MTIDISTPLSSYDQVVIGEIGGKNDEVNESIVKLDVSLTTDLASEVMLTLYDPDFKMHEAGYFVIRRPVTFMDMSFEIASVEIERTPQKYDFVKVMARTRGIQKLKRDKGSANFGKISPSTFAQQKAKEFGMGIFAEGSPAKAAIVRTLDENTDESTMDVLSRLAGDNNFIVFETGNILYFASEEFIIENQTDVFFNPIDQNEFDPWYLHQWKFHRSNDEVMGFDVQFQVNRTNGRKLRPGMVAKFKNVEYFDKPCIITSVEWEATPLNEGLGEATPQPVRVQARTPEETDDVATESKTTKRGDRGTDVRRLQQALKSAGHDPGPIDGIFGPKTERGVKSFQAAEGLPVTGVADPATWAKLDP